MAPDLGSNPTPPAAPAKATPGPWRIGAHGGIVSDSPIESGVKGTEDTSFYGGYLICETVAPCNAPLIAAAPALLEALEAEEQAESLGRHLDVAGGSNAKFIEYRQFKDKACALRRAAIAVVKGEPS